MRCEERNNRRARTRSSGLLGAIIRIVEGPVQPRIRWIVPKQTLSFELDGDTLEDRFESFAEVEGSIIGGPPTKTPAISPIRHHFEAETWEKRLGRLLRPPSASVAASQKDLFDGLRGTA